MNDWPMNGSVSNEWPATAKDKYEKELKRYDDPLTKNFSFSIAREYIAALEAENKALRDKLVELTRAAEAYSERAEAKVAALEAELASAKDSLFGYEHAIKRANRAEAALERLRVCGEHCPACVPFTTMFTAPKHDYLGCLRLYSDSDMKKDHAPIGEPCPYGGWTAREEAGDE